MVDNCKNRAAKLLESLDNLCSQNDFNESDYELLCVETYKITWTALSKLTDESTLKNLNSELRKCLKKILQLPLDHGITIGEKPSISKMRYLEMVSEICTVIGLPDL